MLKGLLISAIFLFHLSTAFSQSFVFNRLSIQDGLLSNNILALWQDKTGYLWIGTENGLQRYDGYSFRNIFPKRVDQIITDNKQRLWLRSGKTIGTLDTSTFIFKEVKTIDNLSAHDVNSIWLYTDLAKNPFVVIQRTGCLYYDEQQKSFSAKANPFIIPDSVRVINVVEDSLKNRYWITSYQGLGYWDKKARKFYSIQNNEQNDVLLAQKNMAGIIAQFYIDKRRRYWIQTWNQSKTQFHCYDANQNKFTNDTAGLADAGNGSYFDIFGFRQFTDTNLFVYGKQCLRFFSNGIFREVRGPVLDPYSIRFNTVYQMLQDRERILWFATDDGLYSTTSNITQNFHVVVANPKNNASINCLFEDDKKQLWLGTWGGGIYVVNEQEQRTSTIPSIHKMSDGFTKLIWSICPAMNSADIWIGCQEGRLIIYNSKTSDSRLYKPAAFRNSTVRQIATSPDGKIWIGLNNGNIFVCDDPAATINESSFRLVQRMDGHISRLKISEKKQLWIAVNGKGVYVLDPPSEKIVSSLTRTSTASEIINDVRDFLQVNDSLCLLAGSELGFYNTQSGSVNTVSSYNNMPIGTVYTFQKDEAGDCWIGTSNGIFKFNPKTQSMSRYSQRDGMITVHNSSYIPETSIRLNDGRLAFGGNHHFVAFKPSDYRSNTEPPAVTITAFQLNNSYLRLDSLQQPGKIELSYTDNSFGIEFASLSFLQHDKLTYEYKLEGADEGWIEIKHPVPARYNVLPPGYYRFLVRARNSDGVYSPTVSSLSVRIRPPFWKTIWFYILTIFSVLGLLYYLHRLRLQRLLHVEKVRSRLARDLHDDMGSTLSTINILSNIALKQTPLDERSSKEYMSTINSSTTHMMESMDDIVWSINPVNDSLVKVTARMKEVAGNVLEPNNIDYHFDASPEIRELNFSMEWRRDIFLIFKEALNNIIKYSRCRNVYITLTKSGRNFLLIIADDGVGFDMGTRQSSMRGNGLKNMKKRAETIDGSFEVDTAPGKGTRITISVPIA